MLASIQPVFATFVRRLQDVSGGKPVRVGDTNLWGMEIDVAAAAEEIRSIGKADKGKGVEDVLGSFGLGAFADQLKDLRLSKRSSSICPLVGFVLANSICCIV